MTSWNIMYKLIHATYTERNPFKCVGDTHEIATPTKLQSHHVLILWGGIDVDTNLYGETPNNYCANSQHGYLRDLKEIALIKKAVELNIPIIGICRGAQLLCVHTGGTLVQHIFDHTNNCLHNILTEDGQTLLTNSDHHQALNLTNEDQKLIAWSKGTFGIDQHNNSFFVKKIPEIVHFPKIRALGIQGHPEWAGMPKETNKYIDNLIKTLLL